MIGKVVQMEMPSLKSQIEYIWFKCKIDRNKDEKLFQKCCDAYRDSEEVEINPIFEGDAV